MGMKLFLIRNPSSPLFFQCFYSFRFKWNDSYFFFCPG
ncbi:hypothetical protein BACOVA_03325 [Bacteroides ovatus ATCC 8483]|uniref:Uncharacterized protein n=1 Tax=Bacteroides ovatus (strain ATCC 8483 / DSM 1896 / JCM 5824 / BCRC 10623 / CCUG 4943 / NCTC 11153) TaxID=411476 RepID=A0AAN3A6D8_BACO1|nr:hypothetical protein BACOVA_03325 [Bacteroides ovatus ATCC 8483]